MSETVLILLCWVASVAFNYFGFLVLQSILSNNRAGFWAVVSISILNSSIAVVTYIYLTLSITYILAFICVFVEIILLFRKPILHSLYGVLAILVNLIAINTCVLVLFAWIFDYPVAQIINTPIIFYKATLYTKIIEFVLAILFFELLPMRKIHLAIQIKLSQSYLLVWMGFCVIFLFANLQICLIDIVDIRFFILELSFCLCILMSCYVMLFYTFHFNTLMKSRKKNKQLICQIGNQERMQSTLIKDQLFIAQTNLTKNHIISGLQMYADHPEFDNDYDLWFKFVVRRTQPEFKELFSKTLNRKTLLENFEKGIEPKSFEYQRPDKNGELHWTRLILRMFRDKETNDVHIVGYGFDIEDEVAQRNALKQEAQRDGLTGLLNKVATEACIGEKIKCTCGCLFIMDIDDFKSINDTYGHDTGDIVIKFIADALRETYRESDVIGRVGGDEYMVYLEGVTQLSKICRKLDDLYGKIRTTFADSPYDIQVTVSVGGVVVDDFLDDFSLAYKRADTALYHVKKTSKNNYAIYNYRMI